MDSWNFRNVEKEATHKKEAALTPEQFQDLYLYISNNGRFAGIRGVSWRALAELTAIDEPTDRAEGMTIYLSNGLPVAAYEFDIGFRVMPEINVCTRISFLLRSKHVNSKRH
ncbi:hypothetical protein [Pantoea sp. App145]|uniref:hypothetical protein n=1 Tax=Pantoea sp. App145 TaxID=3071567 RepID=UPI003A7F718B